jgi:hypothetical protein
MLIVKPNEDPNIRGDAFKTLIVARLSYDADERDLEREFGRFGPIERVRVLRSLRYNLSTGTDLLRQIRIIVDTHAHEKPNKKKKPHRGYAFVVFEREKDMRGKLFQSLLCYMTIPNPNSGGYTSEMWPSGLPICRSIPQETFTRPSSLPVSFFPIYES